MPPFKLADAKQSVHDFLNEAAFCATNGKGFAAMCTSFSVILAVSEAVTSYDAIKDLIDVFVTNMVDKSTWVESTMPNMSDSDISQMLTDVRNGLVHALALPGDVALVDTITVYNKSAIPNAKWFIGTKEFVEVTGRTVDRMILANPGSTFDPRRGPTTGRDPAVGMTFSLR